MFMAEKRWVSINERLKLIINIISQVGDDFFFGLA